MNENNKIFEMHKWNSNIFKTDHLIPRLISLEAFDMHVGATNVCTNNDVQYKNYSHSFLKFKMFIFNYFKSFKLEL